MARTVTKQRVQAREVGIMECFASHAEALKKLGATKPQLDALRRAAEAVLVAQRRAMAAKVDPVTATAPVMIRALACTVPPATKEMRSWARTAMEAVTGGSAPMSGPGQAMALLAGAWALREVAAGRTDHVMRSVATKCALPQIVGELLSDLRDSCADFNQSLSELAEDYARAMGFLMPPLMAGATQRYHQAVEQICLEIVRRPPSRRASSRPNCSASVGKPTGAVNQRRFSTRGSKLRSAASRRGLQP